MTGQVHDDREAAQVEVCAAPPGEPERDCLLFDVLFSATPNVADWYALAPLSGDEDGAWRTFYFYGHDSVGNRSVEPVSRTVQVDVVAPDVAVNTVLSGVVQATLNTILTGTVGDGHSVETLPPETQLYLAKPNHTAEWHPLAFDGSASPLAVDEEDWSYSTTISETGEYQLGVQFRDEAGNLQLAGPFGLTVYESADVASVSLEQSVSSDPAITDQPLTYTFTVHNHGPSVTSPTLTISLSPTLGTLSLPPDCVESDGEIVCDLDEMDDGDSVTIEVQVFVPLTTTGKLICWAAVQSSKVDLNPVDNQTEPLYTPVVQPITGLEATTDDPTVYKQTTTLLAAIASGTGIIFDWNLGDGETVWGLGGYELGANWVVTHVYPAVGVYTTVVTATNSINVLTATVLVEIKPVPVGGYTESASQPTWLRLWITLIAAVGLAVLVTIVLKKCKGSGLLSNHEGG
jgi:hypothetical protein